MGVLQLNSNGRYAVIGASGSGKSNLSYLLFEDLRRRGQPLAIIDHKGEYLDLPNIIGVRPDRITGPDLAQRLRSSNTSVVIDVRHLDKPQSWVRDFVNSCLKLPRKAPILIAIEEVHDYCPQDGTALSKRAINNLAAQGRGQGYGCVLISQRCAKLNKIALAEMEYLYILRHNLQRDIDYLSDFVGDERAATIRQMGVGQFLTMDQPNYKFYQIETAPLATNKGRGGTPQAQAVKPNIQALVQERTKPYSNIKQQQSKDFAIYAVAGIVVTVIVVFVGLWIYKIMNQPEVPASQGSLTPNYPHNIQ